MQRKILSLALAALIAVTAAVSAFAENHTGGTPWLDPEILGNVTAETNVELKDNFVLAVNYDLYLNGEIPEGRSSGGTISNAKIATDNELVEMFKSIDPSSGHDAEQCVNYYSLLLDWDARNALGITPILPTIEAIKTLDSIDAVSAYLTNTDPADLIFLPFDISVDADPNDAAAVALTIHSAHLLLEESDFYMEESPIGARMKDAYTTLAMNLLLKVGYSEAEAAAIVEADYAFESRLAATAYSLDVQNSPEYASLQNNPMSVNDMSELCGAYPITAMLSGFGLETDNCIVKNPGQLRTVSELYTEENLDGIKAYLIVNTLYTVSKKLDRECYEWAEACSNSIDGIQGMIEDEVMASTMTSEELSWPVSRVYCDTYVTEEDKTTVRGIIDQTVSAYRGVLENAAFISDETRACAIEKLDNMTIRCLYPDDWTPYAYDSVEIKSSENGGTLFDADRSIRRYQIEKQAARLNQPVDRDLWADEATPSVLNCFYNPSDNSINILAAFARGEIYNGDMSVEETLAILGSVIGHEISHAFDSSGSQYDAVGNMKNWWTEEDLAAFTAKNERISEYFSSITVWEGERVNGSTLTGEACADMGGIAAVLRIAKTIDNFDYDAFFRAFAKVWFNVEYPERTQSRIASDPHPIMYLRANVTVQQFEEFYETYGIQEGDGMYLSEEDRIKVW